MPEHVPVYKNGTVIIPKVAGDTFSGLGTADFPQFAGINVGHATDSTVTRVSAGVLAIEGATIVVQGGALGTPASGTLTNCSGLPGAGVTAPTFIAQTPGATVTIDASTFPMTPTGFATLAMAGNYTLTWINGTPGQKIQLEALQDVTGSRTLAYTAVTCKFSATEPSPTLSTAANKKDRLLWQCTSSGVFLLIGHVFGADV